LADAGSRGIVGRLAAEVRSLGVLVVVSVGAQRHTQAVDSWRQLAQLIRAGHAESLRLRPLGHPQARQLLAHELGTPPSESQVAVVLERTGGNVALMAALARQAVASAEDIATVSPSEDALIPLRAQLDELEPVGRQALELLAVLGKPTTLALLVAFIDQPEGHVLAAVERAERDGLVVARELAGETFLWFAQGLLHELLLQETGGVTRTCWSRRGVEPERDVV
ncbi:MAG: hypothetical protein R3249_10840, partial [Nitriliruptorales bacterium]|nr:hypothetical protein [Nitriliruptorales bacterium]